MGGFLYVCSVAVLICLAVPRQLLSFAGGDAFGPLFGAVFATLGVTLGCVLAFGMSRYCGRSFVERRYGGKAAAFNRYAVQRPFILAILIRLFPSGNNLVSVSYTHLVFSVVAVTEEATSFCGVSSNGSVPEMLSKATCTPGGRSRAKPNQRGRLRCLRASVPRSVGT